MAQNEEAPKLNVERRTYFSVQWNELEALIAHVYKPPIPYRIREAEDLTAHHIYEVEVVRYTDEDEDELVERLQKEGLKGFNPLSLRSIMRDLCNRCLLPEEGTYHVLVDDEDGEDIEEEGE